MSHSSNPASGNPLAPTFAENLKRTVAKAKDGDKDAQRALLIFSMVGGAAVAEGIPAAAAMGL